MSLLESFVSNISDKLFLRKASSSTIPPILLTIGLLISSNDKHKNTINANIIGVSYPFIRIISYPIENIISHISDYQNFIKYNRSITATNLETIMLKKQIALLHRKLEQHKTISKLQTLHTEQKWYNYTMAKILYYENRNSKIVWARPINNEELESIIIGSIVQNQIGLVGKVVSIAKNKQMVQIQLASSNHFRTTAMKPDGQNYYILAGDGKNNLNMLYQSIESDMEDIHETPLFTTPIENLSVPTIYIGQMKHQPNNTYKVELGQDLNKLEYIEIISPNQHLQTKMNNKIPVSISSQKSHRIIT